MQTVNFDLLHHIWSEVNGRLQPHQKVFFSGCGVEEMGTVPEKYQRQLLSMTADQITDEEAEEQHGEAHNDENGVSVTGAPAHLYPTLLHFRRYVTDCAAQLPVLFFSFECIYFKPFYHFALQIKTRF